MDLRCYICMCHRAEGVKARCHITFQHLHLFPLLCGVDVSGQFSLQWPLGFGRDFYGRMPFLMPLTIYPGLGPVVELGWLVSPSSWFKVPRYTKRQYGTFFLYPKMNSANTLPAFLINIGSFFNLYC